MLHTTGAVLGATGFGIQIWHSDNPMLFVVSLILIAFSEVITCMQSYVKEEYGPLGTRPLRLALRVQYASNVAGTCIGFAGTGALGFMGAKGLITQGSFGLFLEVMELITLGLYLRMRYSDPSSKPDEDFINADHQEMNLGILQRGSRDAQRDSESAKSPKDTKKQASTTLTREHRLIGSTMRWGLNALKDPSDSPSQISSELVFLDNSDGADLAPTLNNYSSSNQNLAHRGGSLQWINYVVAMTFAVQALMIGTVLSTGPILLYADYGLPIQYIGLLFGFGEFLGTLAMLFLIPHKSIARNFVPGPFNIIGIQATIGTMACMLTLRIPYLSITLISLIMGLNDFGTSLTSETQGATISPDLYPKINMLGNVSRRLGNTITAILGPILYQSWSYAPFMAFGVLMIFWSMLLLLLFETRGMQVISKIESPEGIREKMSEPLSGLRHYFRGVSFVSSELLYQDVQYHPRKSEKEKAF